MGQTVVFKAGRTTLCTAVTNANGTASCKLSLSGATAVVANLRYPASFAGSQNFLPSTGNGPLIR